MPRVSHVEIPVEARGREPVIHLTERVFLPLARIWLRYGLNAYEVTEILRWAMTQTALHDREFVVEGRHVYKQTVSHAAVRTGIPRRIVDDLASRQHPNLDAITAKYHRAARVLSGWRQDPEFLDDQGEPLVLPLRGKGCEPGFDKLAMRYGRDVPARAVADELIRSGNAEKAPGRKIRLLAEAYTGAAHSPDDIEILTRIAVDFMDSLARSLDPHCSQRPRFREVFYEHIPAERSGKVRELILSYISQQTGAADRLFADHNDPGPERGDCTRLGVGFFSIGT